MNPAPPVDQETTSGGTPMGVLFVLVVIMLSELLGMYLVLKNL